MDSRNDSPSFLPPPPPSQPPATLFSSSSASSFSSSTSPPPPPPPPPPAQVFSQSSSLSLAAGLEPLTPVIPSSSELVQSEENLVLRDKLAFSSSPLSSSPPSPPRFLGSPAFKAFVSSPAEPKIASSRELPCPAESKILSFVGFAASSSASPTGMGQLGGDLSTTFSSSFSQPPPGPAATSPAATTATATAAGEDIGVPRPLEALQAFPVPPFLSKTYELVDDAFLDAVVSWGPSGDSFVVWDPVEFSRTVLPRHFKHSNFSSFVRQLNTYGFHKIDTDRWEFANEDFLRGHKHLLRNIHRRRSSQVQQIGSYLGSSIEVVRSRLEGEVEKLRKEKNLCMQEVVKLQKEHLTMIDQMDTVKLRMQQAERRQKQMVSFLAKFLQNPAFLDHLRQQKEHREIASTRIRRKFLKQPKSNQSELGSPCEGQIAKYEQTLDGVISSSMNQVMETNVPNQLPDFLFQEIEDELGLIMNGQEFFQTSETGERIPAFTDTNDSSFKGKSIISTPMDTSSPAAECFVSFLEDVSQENLFLDAISQENEDITLPEETLNMNFMVGASLLNRGDDVWDKLFDEDAQKQGVESGSSTVWNIVSGKGGDLEIDKLVGVQLSFQGHQEQVGLTKEDPLKNNDP